MVTAGTGKDKLVILRSPASEAIVIIVLLDNGATDDYVFLSGQRRLTSVRMGTLTGTGADALYGLPGMMPPRAAVAETASRQVPAATFWRVGSPATRWLAGPDRTPPPVWAPPPACV